MLAKNTHYKYRKNNKYNKIHDFGKEEAKKGPEMSAKIVEVTRCMPVDLFKITIDTIGH